MCTLDILNLRTLMNDLHSFSVWDFCFRLLCSREMCPVCFRPAPATLMTSTLKYYIPALGTRGMHERCRQPITSAPHIYFRDGDLLIAGLCARLKMHQLL